MGKTYDFVIDVSADTSHTRIIRLVGRDKRVLEFGCAIGYMSRILIQQFGCAVTGVEVDPEAARFAQQVAHRVIVGDAEVLDYAKELGDARFEVMIFADVLEHLKDPVAVLRRIRPFLDPGGCALASIPNVAHSAVALDHR